MENQFKTQSLKILVWILFGFVFLTAVTSLLNVLIYAYMHYGFSDEFYLIHFKYYIPAFSVLIYGIVAMLLILFIRKKTKKNLLTDYKISKIGWFILIILAIFLEPLTQIISDRQLENNLNDPSQTLHMSSLDIEAIFEIVDYSIRISKWTMILALIFYFSLKSRSK